MSEKIIYGYSTWDYEPVILMTEFKATKVADGVYDIMKPEWKEAGYQQNACLIRVEDFDEIHTYKDSRGVLYTAFLDIRDDARAKKLFLEKIAEDISDAMQLAEDYRSKYQTVRVVKDPRKTLIGRNKAMTGIMNDVVLIVGQNGKGMYPVETLILQHHNIFVRPKTDKRRKIRVASYEDVGRAADVYKEALSQPAGVYRMPSI